MVQASLGREETEMNTRSKKCLFPHAPWIPAALAVMALLLAACGSSGAGNATPTVPPAAPATIVSTAAPVSTTGIYAVTPSGSAAPSSTGAVPATGATAAPTAGIPATQAAGKAVVNVVSNPKLGNILVDDKGMTLYILTKDPPDRSTCSASCLKLWPPLLTQGDPLAGPGADKNMLAWTALADGSRIVTYNHMPLYHFSGDKNAGDTNGQGLNKVWFVVSPDGKPVTTNTTQNGTGGYGSSGG